MSDFFGDPAAELAVLSKIQQTRQITRAEALKWLGSGDTDFGRAVAGVAAAYVVDHTNAHPWQDAGVTLDLAENGVSVDDPLTTGLAAAAISDPTSKFTPATRFVDKDSQEFEVGTPMFTRDPVSGEETFTGFEKLSAEENDLLVGQVEGAVLNGDINRDDVNRALREEYIDPKILLSAVSDYQKPYDVVLGELYGEAGVPQNEEDVLLTQFVYSLDYERVQEMAAEWEARGADRSPGSHGFGSKDAHIELNQMAHNEYSGFGWRDEMRVRIDAAVPEAERALRDRIQAAAEARGDYVPEPEMEDDGGGWFDTAKQWAGNITRPTVGIMDYGRQATVNRLRQNIGMMTEGLEGGLSPYAGSPTGLQQPTVINQANVIDQQTLNAGTAAAGTIGTSMDLATVAAVPLAPVARMSFGSGVRAAGAITLGIDAAEAAMTPDRWRERFEATDIGAIATNPELQGSGFLMHSDLVALRMDRERELGPALPNGDLITFGRLNALAIGSFASALENAPGGWGAISESSPIGWFAEAANPGSEQYNLLSGLTDFAVAVAGPAELYADTVLVGIRNARALPGVRGRELIGNSDPFRAAGGVGSSWRNTVLRADFDEWIGSTRGHRVAEALAELDTTEDVFRAFKGKITVQSARAIADTNTADGVSNFLRLQMGSEVQGVPRLGRVTGFSGTLRNVDTFGTKIRARVPGWERWSHDLPQHSDSLNLDDLDSVYRWSRDYLANASIPRSQSDEILEGLARTGFNDRHAYILNRVAAPVVERMYTNQLDRVSRSWVRKLNNLRHTADEVAEIRRGWEENVRRNVNDATKHHVQRGQELRGYHTDIAGGVHPNNPLAMIGDDGIISNNPHLPIEAEAFRMAVPNIDDLRNIRRVNSAAYQVISHIPPARLLANPAHGTKLAAEWLTGVVWKPFVLLRAAYVMRVVGEEQIRIAAAGGDALVNNPLGWLAWTFHKNLDEGVGKVSLSDTVEYRNAMVGGGRTVREVLSVKEDMNRAVATVYTTFHRSSGLENGFPQAWAGNLSKLTQDAISREVAGAGGVTDDLLARMLSDPELQEALRVAQSIALRGDVAIDLSNPEDLVRYLESVDERIGLMTGGNDDLRNAIATGRYGDDIPVVGSSPGAFSVSDEFVEEIKPLVEGFAPEGVRGLDTAVARGRSRSELFQHVSRILDIMGAAIIEMPTSRFSRVPVFRQNYWGFVSENADTLSAEAAADILSRGLPDGLPRDVRRTLRYRLENVTGYGMDANAMDLAARVHAMQVTNDLLYNMITRNQFADASRLMAPFAEAWAEILTTWGRNVATNPNVLRRFSQAKTVLSDPDFAESLEVIPGFETVDGHGLIFTNDYGQEMIILPWANGAARLIRWASDKVGWRESSGLPMPPQAIPLNSLNVGASIIPGVGPVVSVGIAKLMPDWMRSSPIPGAGAEVRDVIWPFGEPSESVFDLPAELEPSWVRYLRRAILGGNAGEYTSGQEAMTYIGKVNVALRWLAANDRSGAYDQEVHGPAAQNQLFEDARRLTNEIAWAQAFSSYFGPAPSSSQFWILDENGDVQLNRDDPNSGTFISVITAANLFRAFRDEGMNAGMEFGDAENAAYLKLIEATGSRGSVLATISASAALLAGGVPATRSAYEWVQNNSAAKDEARTTWGLFASLEDPDDDEFYQPMYWETIREDTRERNSEEDMRVIADDISGNFLYGVQVRALEEELGMSIDDPDLPDEIEDVLGQYAVHLQEVFPRWRDDPHATRGTPATMAQEIERVTAPDAVLGDHPLADALQEISRHRQVAFDMATDNELSNSEMMPLGTVAASGVLNAYDEYLGFMLGKHPDLAEFISRVYRAEIRAAIDRDRGRDGG